MWGNQFFAPVETGTLTAGKGLPEEGRHAYCLSENRDQLQRMVRWDLDIPDNYVHSYTDAVIMDNKSLRSKKNVRSGKRPTGRKGKGRREGGKITHPLPPLQRGGRYSGH